MTFRRLLISLSWCYLLSFTPVSAEMGGGLPTKSVQDLAGEDLSYFMDFLVFEKLAAGRLHLAATDRSNVYRVELVGRTLGIASWLAGNRVQTYTTLMELTPDGSLRTIEHTSRVQKKIFGKLKDRGKRYRYDYVTRKVSMAKAREGVYQQKEDFVFPEGLQPVDMLAAFYNLRAGFYGPLVPGAEFKIPTLTKDGFSDIEVAILTVKEQATLGFFPPAGLLLQITLDPEIFDTGGGSIYVWFNGAGTPERGIVEDVIGLGNVKGYRAEGLH